jgi:formylglycine-generating enzyme required for sulfatase activity
VGVTIPADAASAPAAPPAAVDAAPVSPDAGTTSPDAAAPAACGTGTGGNAWAGWPMIEPRQRRYDLGTAGVVLDQDTRLMWQRQAAPNELDWDSAGAYCGCLSLGGFDDWRLPTRIELLTIVDYTKQDPSIDETIFPDTPVTWFWTSSTVAEQPLAAWYLSFMDGNTHDAAKEVSYGVRCVRQGNPGRQPYQVSPDGSTVTDPTAKLTWQRALDGKVRSWEEARAHCAQLPLAGGGWRLPTMAELQTLIDESAAEPAIDQKAFPDTPRQGFWCSTPLADQPPYYWFVGFDRGIAYNSMSMHEYNVRCVR